MTQEKYFEKFIHLQHRKIELTQRKNSDYADKQDAFANFKLIEVMTAGKITAEMGILVRMSDKMQRIANLIFRENQVKDEKITDTLMDLSIYSDILNLYLDDKNLPQEQDNATREARLNPPSD